jgi:hypothetical protein
MGLQRFQENPMRLVPIVALSALVLSLAPPAVHSQSSPTASLPSSARLALPGDKHRWLDPLVGQWKVEMKVWPAAGAAPIVSSDLRARREWVLGGRYLREELSGNFAGNPSSRIALLGFNNLEERFELTTLDTFEPGQMTYASVGAGQAQRLTLVGVSTEAGMGPKPTGRKRDLRFDWEIGERASVQRIFVKYPGEPEFLFVEQRFTPSAQP